MSQRNEAKTIYLPPTFIGAQPPSTTNPVGGGFNVGNNHGGSDHHGNDHSFAYLEAWGNRKNNIEQNYAITMGNLRNLINQELQVVKSKFAIATNSPTELLTIEVNARNELAAIKTAEFGVTWPAAISFYGVNPIGKTEDDFWGIYNANPTKVDPDKLLKDWTNSYYSAHVSSVLLHQINTVNNDAIPFKDSLTFLSDFNKEILNKFGGSINHVAQGLQNNVSGKRVTSYAEALATFEKVNANPAIKLSAHDAQAVVNALNALNVATLGDNMIRLGKAFGVVGYGFQAYAVLDKTRHGAATGDWKPLLLELQAIGMAAGAGAVLGAGLAVLLPLIMPPAAAIILGALILAAVASQIDAAKVDEINGWFVS